MRQIHGSVAVILRHLGRATRAEEWLLRIHNEVENSFFQKNDCAPRRGPQQ